MSTILEGITMFVHVSTQSVGAVAFNPVLTDSGSKLTIGHLFHNRGGYRLMLYIKIRFFVNILSSG